MPLVPLDVTFQRANHLWSKEGRNEAVCLCEPALISRPVSGSQSEAEIVPKLQNLSALATNCRERYVSWKWT